MRPVLFLLFSLILICGASAGVQVFSDQNCRITIPKPFQQLPPRDDHNLYLGKDGDKQIDISYVDGGDLPLDDPWFANSLRAQLQSTGCVLQDSEFVEINKEHFLVTRFTQPVDKTDGISYIIVADGRVLMITYAGHNLGDAVVPNSLAVMESFRFIFIPVIPQSQRSKVNNAIFIFFIITLLFLLLAAIYTFFFILRDSIREVLKRVPFLIWVHG